MADKLPAFALAGDKIVERNHLVDRRHPSFSALFESCYHNLSYAVGADDLSLGELTRKKAYLVDAHLRGFLHHPLYALHHLRRGYG